MKVYGDHFIQSIQKFSKELDLSLDGIPESQPSVPKQKTRVPNEKNLTQAKFQAWKMWQEDGLSLHRIANSPARSAPVKEQTILEYVLEAAREGYVLDWIRFSGEIGLTEDVRKCILAAVSKVGKEKLKPIKNELPEEVTYSQIRTCMTMQELGLTMEGIPSNDQDTCKEDINMKVASQTSESHSCEKEEYPPKLEPVIGNENCSPSRSDDPICDPSVQSWDTEEALDISHEPTSRKRPKLNTTDLEASVAPEATRSSILRWLQNFDEGVNHGPFRIKLLFICSATNMKKNFWKNVNVEPSISYVYR